MIKQVRLEYFKRFGKQSFDLDDVTVLAGPNDAGKTTLLQAIATWHFAYQAWARKHIASRAKKRKGVAIGRKEFLAIPVQRFNLLWQNTSTALNKEEGGGRGAAVARIMKITVVGEETEVVGVGKKEMTHWQHTMEFRYANSELIYIRPSDDSCLPKGGVNVVYIPSFSGIEIEEKVHTREFQDWLVGQGKPGDFIRNLLVEVAEKPQGLDWKELGNDMHALFGCKLEKPQRANLPFIRCEYRPANTPPHTKLDIASAGSGFLQTLLLLAFIYARPATLLLVDEPDAHMHFNLQERIYAYLENLVSERSTQVVIATHSEVVINRARLEDITSLYGKQPRRLTLDKGRKQVKEALKLLSDGDILLAEQGKVFYAEGHTDFKYLEIWAGLLRHPLHRWLTSQQRYCSQLGGKDLKKAHRHFFALRAISPEMSGIVLFDGNGGGRREDDSSEGGLRVLQWRRYEIENYLIHPTAIQRFANEHWGLFANEVMGRLESILPPTVMQDPMCSDAEYTASATDRILPRIFGEKLPNRDYIRIAEAMEPDEIPPEVKEKLDAIHKHLRLP